MVEIFPYKSVGPIQFGMDAIQVHSALGQPWANDKNGSGDKVLHFQGLVVTIAPTGVVEVGLLPETPSSFAGINIFSSPSAFQELCRMDGAPREYLGFVVLPKLGITMTGFHDGDESQKAVTAFISGRWDSWLPKMKPFLFSI